MTEPRLECGIDFTPQKPDQKDRYKYLCPVCMFYFETINVTMCCQNYYCAFCTVDALETNDNKLDPVCPFCSASPLAIRSVTKEDEVKLYLDEQSQRVQQACVFSSPLNIGASREEMMRKMIPLEKIQMRHADNSLKERRKSLSDAENTVPVTIRELFIKTTIKQEDLYSVDDEPIQHEPVVGRPESAPSKLGTNSSTGKNVVTPVTAQGQQVGKEQNMVR
ncbi:SLC9A3, partial [Acrasis kona]